MGSINLGTNGTITNLSSASGAYDNDLKSDIALLGFYRAADNSKNKYNLTNQVIDEFNDSSGVDASASTNELVEAGGYVSGSTGNNYPTGGTITTHGSYRVHSFLSTGNTDFVVSGSGTVDMLVVGGGGGGGTYGGGGAGGVRTKTGHSVTAQTYVVAVGAGAVGIAMDGSDHSTRVGTSGSASSFDSFESAGGGGGGGSSYSPHWLGQAGASGGGTGTDIQSGGSAVGGAGNTPSTDPVQGYAGGQGQPHGTAHVDYAGGGGGGAGAVGGNASQTGTATGGTGGIGIQNNFRTGSNVYYGGGGGGQGYMYSGGADGVAGAGGNGGGGAGMARGPSSTVSVGVDGTANTGGGGGADSENTKTDGGSGIVVIRYATTEFPGIGDLTLQSTDSTASSAPTKADFHCLIENASGTATINTDIKAYISRDSGANWTQGTLVDEGSWGTNRKVLAVHDLDVSGQPSGTAVCYKVTTHNQAAGSKLTRIHATSLGWK